MSSLRNNALSRTSPDPYGNMYGSMIPQGAIVPTRDLNKRKKNEELEPVSKKSKFSSENPNEIYSQAQESVKNLKPIEEPEKIKQDMDYAGGAMNAMTQAAGAYGGAKSAADASSAVKAAGGVPKAGALGNMKPGAAAGVGAGGAVLGMVGANMSANNKEDIGGALSGMGSGAGLGMTLGSVVPGIGNVAGAIGGAAIGGITGLITGKSKKKAREKAEAKEKAARDKYNAEIAEQKRKTLGWARDEQKFANIKSASSQYDKSGNLMFRKGGIFRYQIIPKNEVKAYLKNIENQEILAKQEEGKLENTPVINVDKFKMGGKLATVESCFKKNIFSTEEILKKRKDWDLLEVEMLMKKVEAKFEKKNLDKHATIPEDLKIKKNSKGGNIKSKKLITVNGKTPIFRRGGAVHVAKQNVIVDGPSHDELNNTGIKGDRGLPVVQKGMKIAEIESEELVINKDAAETLENLVEKYKSTKDESVKKEIGEVLHKELKNNTYDYSDLLS